MLNAVGFQSQLPRSGADGQFGFHRFDHSRGLNNFVDAHLLRRGLILSGFAAALAGAVLGIVVSMIVNSSLVELSISPFFRTYFGMLFLVVSGLITYRVFSGRSGDPDDEHLPKHLLFFSALVALSGIVCLFLRHNWFLHLPNVFKVLTYGLLGTSVAFALTFTLVDLVNVLVGVFQSSTAKPLVQSPAQIRLVISMAIFMGAIFGTTFGVMGVEEEISYHIRLALLREQHKCFPIGSILGAVTGFANEYLRLRSKFCSALQQSEFNEDI